MTAERLEIERAKRNFFRQENAQVMSIKQSLRRNRKGTKRKIGSSSSVFVGGPRNTPPLFTTLFSFSKHLFGDGVMKFIWF